MFDICHEQDMLSRVQTHPEQWVSMTTSSETSHEESGYNQYMKRKVMWLDTRVD